MSDKKSFLDTLSDNSKPESFAEEKFEKVNRGSKKKIIGGILAAVIILGGIYAGTNIFNRVTMPDLVGKTLDEAATWASQNDVTLYQKSVYSLTADADTVVSQETKVGQSVKKNSLITIGVSLGADPEEEIEFPDIKNMTLSEINTWISDNQLTGAKVSTEYSDIVAKDKVIDYSFTDGSEDLFKRKNRVTINVSLGQETLSETVVVTDFSAMKAGAILQWGADNGVSITLEKAFDEYVAAGSVISQSVKANTEMLRTNNIVVVLSEGVSITMPDLSTMTKDDANNWAKANNVNLTVVEKYSDTKTKSTLYGQSVASGKKIMEGDTIKVSCSLGKVSINNFADKTKLDILNWQTDVNTKYANVKLSFSEEYGEKGSAGKILSQSVSNDYISTVSTINVVISKGMKVVIPDFAGKTQAECTMLANNAGVSVLFDYKSTTSVNAGCAVSQSIAAGTISTDAKKVCVVIAVE